MDVIRIQESDDDPSIVGYETKVRVACKHCGEQMRFLGLGIGSMPDRPMGSVDGTELRAPMWPASDPEGEKARTRPGVFMGRLR